MATKTKTKRCVIRKVSERDAKPLLEAFREIARTSDWLLTEADELPKSLAAERAFIRMHTRAKNSMMLVAWVDGEVAGMLGIMGGTKRRNRHAGELGIALRSAHRGKGIGRALMCQAMRWAKKNATLTRIYLNVVRENRVARRLYRSLGFRQEGVALRGMKITGRYHDMINLVKLV